MSLQRKTQAVAEEKIGEVTSKMTSMAGDVQRQGRPALGQARNHLRRAHRQGAEQAGRALGQGRGRADRAHRRRSARSVRQAAPRRTAAPRAGEGRRQAAPSGAAKPRRQARRRAQDGLTPERLRLAPPTRRRLVVRPSALLQRSNATSDASAPDTAAARRARRLTARPTPAHRRWRWPAAGRWAPSTKSARCARSTRRCDGLDFNRLHALRRRVGRRLHRRRRWPTA